MVVSSSVLQFGHKRYRHTSHNRGYYVDGHRRGCVVHPVRFAIRGYAIVGAAFGLLVGIAHTMLLLIARYVVFPAMEAAGLYSLSPAFLFAAMMAIGVIVDITLAVVAFRLFRGRRVAAFADDAARTC
jgi:hypothetical protein